MKDDQFWALTPFMKYLEEFCRVQPNEQRIFIERRENQYRTESVERTRVFKPSELVKSVAAMFMFQPHRAARDYRGIRKEYASKLFQADHSVRLYHAAAFTSYKLEFAIRNKRVDRSWGIYKYYVFFMLGKMLSKSADIFALSSKKQDQVAASILEIAADEEELVKQFTIAANVLDDLIGNAKLDTREKVRDFIRSESVTITFAKILSID